jgi:hypothetical protein
MELHRIAGLWFNVSMRHKKIGAFFPYPEKWNRSRLLNVVFSNYLEVYMLDRAHNPIDSE